MDDIGTMLDREYQNTLEAVSRATTGTEEAKWNLQKLSELHKQRMNEKQASNEAYFHYEELRMKKQQQKEGKTDRVIKVVLETSAILVPVLASAFWMAMGLRFEETGSITSRVPSWVSTHMRLFKR